MGWRLISETKGQVVRKTVDLGGVFRPFGGSNGGPWGHSWGTWPPGMWMRPKDAVDGLSGKFWAPMT